LLIGVPKPSILFPANLPSRGGNSDGKTVLLAATLAPLPSPATVTDWTEGLPMLTDAAIRRLKPKKKPFKKSDRDGLYVLVQPTGARWWRWDYRFRGLRKTLSLGVFDEVELADARDKLAALRKTLASGVDPAAVRRLEKHQAEAETKHTFEALAREWLDKKKAGFAPATVNKIGWLFEGYLFPAIGKRPIAAIEPTELLAVLRRIESKGRIETTHRTKQIAGQVWRYAIAIGVPGVTRDMTADLADALKPVVKTSHAAITDPQGIGALLRAIDGFRGSFVVWQALKLAPLVFVRPGELRKAEWSELDLDGAIWRIQAARMKTREAHLVPLSRQAVEVLRELRPLTGRGRYVFPSIRSSKRPMSDNTLNASLRRLGFGHEEMTAHGFRAMASTRLNEMGWRPDLIERQLAHVEKDNIRATYNRAVYLNERRQMLQAWADHLDALRTQLPAVAS
jgi:integrase